MFDSEDWNVDKAAAKLEFSLFGSVKPESHKHKKKKLEAPGIKSLEQGMTKKRKASADDSHLLANAKKKKKNKNENVTAGAEDSEQTLMFVPSHQKGKLKNVKRKNAESSVNGSVKCVPDKEKKKRHKVSNKSDVSNGDRLLDASVNSKDKHDKLKIKRKKKMKLKKCEKAASPEKSVKHESVSFENGKKKVDGEKKLTRKERRNKRKKKNSKKNKYKHLAMSGRVSESEDTSETSPNLSQDVETKVCTSSDSSNVAKETIKLKKKDHENIARKKKKLKMTKKDDASRNEKDDAKDEDAQTVFSLKTKTSKDKTKLQKLSEKQKLEKGKLKSVSTIKKKGFDVSKLKEMFKSESVKSPQSQSPVKEAMKDSMKKLQKDSVSSPGVLLQERMKERLNSARFRYLNEQMYTTTGAEAFHMFKEDEDAFDVYHQGYSSQVTKWPVDPLDVIMKQIKFCFSSPGTVIADMGCGSARLAQSLKKFKVHSFDLVAVNKRVTACEMSKVPLEASSVDVVVFCLSLMGTNLVDYLLEANRILKLRGVMKIAEVESRFQKIGDFVSKVERLGFEIISKDTSNKMFYLFDFKKVKSVKKDTRNFSIQLDPCIYKKR